MKYGQNTDLSQTKEQLKRKRQGVRTAQATAVFAGGGGGGGGGGPGFAT